MFSPSVSLPFTCKPSMGTYSLILRHQRLGLGVEILAVFRRPPIAEHAHGVEFAALIVEAVADFVADDDADAAIIHRVIGVGIEEWRLQDGRREDDLVARADCNRHSRWVASCPIRFGPLDRPAA